MFAYCTKLKTFESDLSNLSNGLGMFSFCTSLTDFKVPNLFLNDYDAYTMFIGSTALKNWDCGLPNIYNINGIFDSGVNFENFTSNLRSLNVTPTIFRGKGLITFDGYFSALRDGSHMFNGCWRLHTVKGNFSDITNGSYMFNGCMSLETLELSDSGLYSLTNGTSMFYGTYISSFYENLSSLTNGSRMFKDCTRLYDFRTNISNLRNGNEMFNYCQSLSSFSQNLTSLISGDRMFERCQSLTSFNSPLYSLVSANAMFKDCFQPTNRPYTHYYGYGYGYGYGYNSGPVYEGNCTFECRTMNNLICGENMFQNCYGLVSIKASMKALEIGESMFQGMSALRTFSDYGTTSGYSNFSDNLRQLKNGDSMFKNTSFENVRDSAWNHAGHLEYYGQYALNASLGYLRTAKEMFAGCSRLSTFDCNLENLVNGAYMFSGSNLTGFYTESLGSLKTGAYMFYDYNNRRASARLKDSEILNIANVINNISGLNKQDDSQWTYEFPRFSYPVTDGYGTMPNGDLLKDYQATTYNSPYYYNATGSHITYYNCIGAINPVHRGVIHLGSEEQYPQLSSTILNACQILMNKGWTVYVDSYKATACMSCCSGGVVLNPDNGILATSEIDLLDDNDEPITPTVYYYKPVPVPESCASHVDQEGNFFTIMGGQLVFGDDLENYGQFTSFEEAEANMGLTRYNPNKQKKRKREEEQSQPEEENA